MLTISKTTQKYAQARMLFIDPSYCDTNKSDIIWICVNDDRSEPMFSLFANEDGSFNYRGNIWLSAATREEIPAFIRNEKQLRQVIGFIAQDMRQEIAGCFL